MAGSRQSLRQLLCKSSFNNSHPQTNKTAKMSVCDQVKKDVECQYSVCDILAQKTVDKVNSVDTALTQNYTKYESKFNFFD